MENTLIIVESPTKARTLTGFLKGQGITVAASVGHVRDLPLKEMGVDVEDSFRPTYAIPESKQSVVRRLRGLAKRADVVVLAMDPDREGEAIAWHVREVLHGALPADVRRSTFHEITVEAVQHALAQPSKLNIPLVRAQETRRIIDRLMGYGISPVLSHALKERGLSAGRVQTVALRLVREREEAIASFVPTTSYSVAATFEKNGVQFTAALVDERGQVIKFTEKPEAEVFIKQLRQATYTVAAVETKERVRKPKPPFTTSTMQQVASKRLGLSPASVMDIAQQLFEGVSLGEGQPATGLITYMRTDSVAVSAEAQRAAREVIAAQWGAEYVPEESPQYKTRTKGAQEAHGAIRPTRPERAPDSIKGALTKGQFALYDLIWRRFIASQMAPERVEVTTVDIAPSVDMPYKFRAKGTVPIFAGFKVLYRDDEEEQKDESTLPSLVISDELEARQVKAKAHRTKPPARFTEATLIKELEKRGVGRPSTFASIILVVERRDYVELKGRKRELVTTELGQRVLDRLLVAFPDIFAVDFTAKVEARLDEIAAGEVESRAVLREFYAPFSMRLQEFQDAVGFVPYEKRAGPERTGHRCPLCGEGYLVKRASYSGNEFLGCGRYPKCKYGQPADLAVPAELPTCPRCQKGKLIARRGQYGLFWSCNQYPRCKYIQNYDDPVPAEVQACPECGKGFLTRRNGAKGPFMGCTEFPQCKYTEDVAE